MSHLLITGGSGFIGRALVQSLANTDTEITILTRRSRSELQFLPASVALVARIQDIQKVPDVAITLAGTPIAVRWTPKNRQQIESSRIQLSLQLKAQFERLGSAPKRLIAGSAIGFYGTDPEREFTESDSVGNGYASQLCERWETASCSFTELGTEVVRLRTGVVLEQGGGMLKQLLPLFKLGLGGRIGQGTQVLSWIHRSDLVRMIRHIMSHPNPAAIYNGTAPVTVTQARFAELLAESLHRPCFMRHPAWVIQGVYGQMAKELLLNGQNVYPEQALKEGFHFEYETPEKALRAIFSA